MSAVPKPLPAITPDMVPFWEAAKRHQLVVQKCGGCGVHRFPPRELCSLCLSRESSWVPASGRGKVFSFVVMHQAYHPAFADELPYAVVVVELEEGARITSRLVDCPAGEVRIDMPVTVVFEDASPEISLPKFRRT